MPCINCEHVYLKPLTEGGGKECRANPPTVFIVPVAPGQMQTVSVFPPVTDTMECGMYEYYDEDLGIDPVTDNAPHDH